MTASRFFRIKVHTVAVSLEIISQSLGKIISGIIILIGYKDILHDFLVQYSTSKNQVVARKNHLKLQRKPRCAVYALQRFVQHTHFVKVGIFASLLAERDEIPKLIHEIIGHCRIVEHFG